MALAAYLNRLVAGSDPKCAAGMHAGRSHISECHRPKGLGGGVLSKETTIMLMFDVQGIEIDAPRAKVFEFVRNPRNLPKWAHAFRSADDTRATLTTPAGTVGVRLSTLAIPDTGTVDWQLEFPDGGIGVAQSRVTDTSRGTCIYSFVLHAPPVPLEQLEGALETQIVQLKAELAALKSLMET
jgi:uncharacterized protein YndB with AHSA1/START domain